MSEGETTRGDFDHEIDEFLREDRSFLDQIEACRRAQAGLFAGLSTTPAGGAGEALVGAVAGDYRILREVGRGGMGVVYEAEQISLTRRVALKVLQGGIVVTPEAHERFSREARAAAALNHHHIIPVYAFGEINGVPFYSMEYVSGRSLDAVIEELRRQRKAESASEPKRSSDIRNHCRDLAQMFVGVAEALGYAHGEAIVHRDLKPSNLMLDSKGRLLLTDFGLAHHEGSASLTLSGQLLGTPCYMSPEQAAAGRAKVDHRTDLYSLGVTLYELATLELPFSAKDPHLLLTQILTKDPVPPRKRDPRIPRDFETIILKAMEKDPDRRYPGAVVLADDLRSFARGEPIRARPVGPVTRLLLKARRRPAVAATVLVLVFCAAVIAFLGLSYLDTLQVRRQERLNRAVEEGMLLLYSIVKPAKDSMGLEHVRLDLKEMGPPMGRSASTSSVDEALRLFEAATRESPDRPEPSFYLALAHEENGEGTEVDRALEASLRTDPRFVPALLLRASRLDAAGREVEAEELRKSALPFSGDSWAVDWFGARDAERKAAWKGARESYTRLIDSRREPFRGFRYQAFLRRAQAAMYGGDFAEAHLDLARAEGAWEKRPEAEVVRALVLHSEGKKGECDQVLERLLEEGGWDRKLVLRVIEVFSEKGLDRVMKCLEVMRRALEHNPDDEDLLAARVDLLTLRGGSGENEVKVEDPVNAARELVDRNPASFRALMALGNVYLLHGSFFSAISTLERAIRLRPDDPGVWAKLGEAFSGNHQDQKAADALLRSIELRPTGQALVQYCRFLESRGSYRVAEQMLRRGMEVDPLNPYFRLRHAVVQHRLGSWAEARKDLLRLAARRPDGWYWGPDLAAIDPEKALGDFTGNGWEYSQVHFDLDLADEAEAHLRSLPEEPPYSALYSLGILYYFQGRYRDALLLVDRAQARKLPVFSDFEITWLAFGDSDFDRGIPAFLSYVRRVPNPHSPWGFYLDHVQEKLPAPEVEAFLGDLLKLHPDQSHLHHYLAGVHARMGKYETALGEYEACAGTTALWVWDALAALLPHCRSLAGQIDYWTRVASEREDSWLPAWHLARTLEESGEWDRALAGYLRAAESGGFDRCWYWIAGSAARRLNIPEQVRFWDGKRAVSPSVAPLIASELGRRRADDPVRINCGGRQHIDRLGDVWLGDMYFFSDGGESMSKGEELAPVEGTPEQAIYKTQRFAESPCLLPAYRIPLLNGKYLVFLHFAEIWNSAQNPGLRRFDVLIEDALVDRDLDVCREVGYLHPLVKRYETEVRDGVLEITLRNRTLAPKLCAIEVLPASRSYCGEYRHRASAALDGNRPLAEAIAEFHRECADHAERPEAHHLLGEVLLRKGDPAPAAAAFREALRLDPRRLGSRIRLADALRASGSFAEALRVYREAFEDVEEPTFQLWTSIAAASRNALPDAELKNFWTELMDKRRLDDPGSDFAAFFDEQSSCAPAVRLNCAGERVARSDGTVFEHDRAYSGGRMWHTEGQDVDDVYRSARWTTSYEKSFSYRIPVLCGRYKLVLHFSEIVQPLREPGKRIFKLLVQGRPSLESLDIVREAGFRKPLTKSLDIEVTDGLIEVDLVSVKKGPLLSAIEVLPLRSP